MPRTKKRRLTNFEKGIGGTTEIKKVYGKVCGTYYVEHDEPVGGIKLERQRLSLPASNVFSPEEMKYRIGEFQKRIPEKIPFDKPVIQMPLLNEEQIFQAMLDSVKAEIDEDSPDD